MQARDYLLAIGVMTGNSLDGVDVVLTRFDKDGSIADLRAHSLASPPELTRKLRAVRETINTAGGVMADAVKQFDIEQSGLHGTFDDAHKQYIDFVGQGVRQLIDLARHDKSLSEKYDLDNIDVIGFHGQTCAHFPPSIARTKDPDAVYTCQIGDGQMLADITGIPVVYDFRSDDLMAGGEAAPLAPVHHQHLAQQLKKRSRFPVAFCNAGNTSNITVVSVTGDGGALTVMGWDAGPFNNYPDRLVQAERNDSCDIDGRYGGGGTVDEKLLARLFQTAVITHDGRNFLLEPPPKSSDPQWYKLIPELTGEAENKLPFEVRVRTAEYFSAYILAYGLSMVPEHIIMPSNYALCGGGWKNPISRAHFAGLLQGDFEKNPVLPEHRAVFAKLRDRLQHDGPISSSASGPSSQEDDAQGVCEGASPGLVTKPVARRLIVDLSEDFGFDGTAMEARIFADAAVCRVMGKPFTHPSTTGVKRDTVCGIIRYPGGDSGRASQTLRAWIRYYGSERATEDRPAIFDGRWSRASAGWHGRLAAK